MKTFMSDWKHKAVNTCYMTWPSILFIGVQKGCSQAFKDCEVTNPNNLVFGLNCGEYSLASTGTVSGKAKAKANLVKRRSSAQVG